MRPLVVDPDTGETPEEPALAVATQQFLEALAAVDRQTDARLEEPGVESAARYNPPERSDEGSGPHSWDNDEEAPRFNAFGGDRDGW